MREVEHKEWLNQTQFAVLIRRQPATVLEKSADGLTALVEWSTWEPQKEEATA